MISYTIKTRTVKGKTVEVSAPIEGTEPCTGIPIIYLNMMSDEQWNDLAERLNA